MEDDLWKVAIILSLWMLADFIADAVSYVVERTLLFVL